MEKRFGFLNDNEVLVSKEYFIHLIECKTQLEVLQDNGVDNWEWYGESMKCLPYFASIWNEKNPKLKIFEYLE